MPASLCLWRSPARRLCIIRSLPTTAFVVSLNLHRRHLDESQRAKVAAKLANMPQGARTDIQPSANLQNVSQSRAAELLNVGTRTWPTGSLHWADTPEARLMSRTCPAKRRALFCLPSGSPN